LDLARLFGNRRPVEVEVGSGKGAFLLARASLRPEVNLLGIEWLEGYAAYAADRAYRASLENVRVLCADAAEVFRSALPAGCVSRVHIYFPDPWPKRRHRRRRLVQVPFLSDVRRVLRPGGWVGIVTDHEEYFEHIRRVLHRCAGLTVVRFGPGPGGSAEWLVGSNFERKYRTAGKRLYAVAALRYL